MPREAKEGANVKRRPDRCAQDRRTVRILMNSGLVDGVRPEPEEGRLGIR